MDKKIRFRRGLYRFFFGIDIFFGILTQIFLSAMKKWISYKPGSSIGGLGSENGTILYDEEFDGGCRITMEKCPRYYAITCGVYGSMVHTGFRGADDAKDTYEAGAWKVYDFRNKRKRRS